MKAVQDSIFDISALGSELETMEKAEKAFAELVAHNFSPDSPIPEPSKSRPRVMQDVTYVSGRVLDTSPYLTCYYSPYSTSEYKYRKLTW